MLAHINDSSFCWKEKDTGDLSIKKLFRMVFSRIKYLDLVSLSEFWSLAFSWHLF